MEKGIITDFAKKARTQLIREKNFMAVRALDFLVCGAINESHLPADGSIPNQFFCMRCDQRTLDTRKHVLWESILSIPLSVSSSVKPSLAAFATRSAASWRHRDGATPRCCAPTRKDSLRRVSAAHTDPSACPQKMDHMLTLSMGQFIPPTSELDTTSH